MSFRSAKEENRMQRIEQRRKEKEDGASNEQKSKKKDMLSNCLIVFLAVSLIAVYAYTPSTAKATYRLTADGDPSIGPISAPIEIIAFGDMSCPFTKSWVDSTFDPLMKKYDGKILFVYRDFPKYDKHPLAQKAAEAAECANDQGKYWEYFRKLFQMQPALGVISLKQYAVELGLDSAAFNECLDSAKYADEVKKDHSDGAEAGVVTTPTFFINGNKIGGDQKLGAFDVVIGQLLN